MLTITSIQSGESILSEDIDLFIAACGYEERARAAAEKFHHRAKIKLAIGFISQQVLNYDVNKEWFISEGFDFVEVGDDGFREVINSYILQHVSTGSAYRIEIDISCFNRFRLGHLVDSLRSSTKEALSVTFRYSIAEFSPPQEDTAPTVTVEPVIPEFAGWTTRPDRPPAAIVGLGYEPNKAIGIVDHLEINNATWAYYPLGPIPEYYQSVLNANQSLLNIIQADGRHLPYDLDDPAHLFHEMNSLVDTLKPHFNTILIPFGPKIFALISLLVATLHDDIGVWRVSSGVLEPPVNRKPSGHVVAVSMVLSRR